MWSSLVATLDAASRDRLESVLTAKSCPAGHYLYREGDRGDSLFVIAEGHLLVERLTVAGDVVAVALVGPDEIVGEQALVSGDPRVASLRAITAVEGWLLHRAAFDTARKEHRALDRLLIDILDGRIRNLLELLNQSRHESADARLRSQLRLLAEHFGDEIPLTQEVLASMAGVTRPTANTFLRSLSQDGVVELARGHITVCDSERI